MTAEQAIAAWAVFATVMVIVLGWLVTYYAEQNRSRGAHQSNRWWLNFYALVSREFYLIDLYAWLTRALLRVAARLNVWLRWT